MDSCNEHCPENRVVLVLISYGWSMVEEEGVACFLETTKITILQV